MRWIGTRSGRFLLLAAIASGCAGCDQATKGLAARYLEASDPVRLLGGGIRLEYAENSGAFLSFGASLHPALRDVLFLGIVPAILFAWLVLQFRDRLAGRAGIAGLALISGGAIGNILDRMLYGHVRDFAVIRIGPLQTGIFNLADVTLLLGALLMVFGAWKGRTSAGGPLGGRQDR